jgi:hypothetical protein
MPTPLGAEHRLPAVKLAAAVPALRGALVVLQISRLTQVPAELVLKQVFTFGEMMNWVICIAIERDQNPANPSGLLYGIATLVTSSSEPSGLVAYPTSFEAFP